MAFVSVVSGCFNEELNVGEFYERVFRAFANDLPDYDYEFIVIDNRSTDGTVALLKEIAKKDKRVKVIVNNRNFGAARSSYHALLQARGQAVIYLASDLQDLPEMISQFVRTWEQGFKIVLAQKVNSQDS